MASDAVEQLKKRICPRVLADPRGQQMRWPLVVKIYCPYLNAWDTFLNNFLFLHVKARLKNLLNFMWSTDFTKINEILFELTSNPGCFESPE